MIKYKCQVCTFVCIIYDNIIIHVIYLVIRMAGTFNNRIIKVETNKTLKLI